jgi:hypothetical protein
MAKTKTITAYRSSVNGRFTTAAKAKKSPRTHEKERIKIRKGR